MNASRIGEGSGPSIMAAQGVVLMKKDNTFERRADQALWLLNHLHVPLTLRDLEDSPYDVLDIMTSPSSSGSHSGGGAANSSGGGVRNPYALGQPHHRNSPHRLDRQHHHHYQPPLPSISSYDMMSLSESLDRKYKFTEDTVFWTMDQEYNVVFVIDMSQSMYSIDPSTNNVHIHTALDTLEKCLAGMIQPFTVQSTLGMPGCLVEPHICVSVVGYCPRKPGSYPAEKNRKKLPFCRTLIHARMVTSEDLPDILKSVRNFMFNYESEIQDSLGSFPPPPPPIPLDRTSEAELPQSKHDPKPGHHGDKGRHQFTPLDSAKGSGRVPQAGDMFTLAYDEDAPLLHTLQIVDYFLKIMPEVCSPAFVYLTDGVLRSNFAASKAQSVISSLSQRNTLCTFIQVGSCGGFTPETSLGFVGDNELLMYLAATLNGRFIYASDCPDAVLPQRANFYHQAMLIQETRLARTPMRYRYDHVFYGGSRPGDVPRERINTKKDGVLQTAQSSDAGFPWVAECKPPLVNTLTVRYSDYNIPVSLSLLVEARMNEGFVVRNIQIAKLDREGMAERVNIKMEMVWHPNVTIVYRITNTHFAGQHRLKLGEKALSREALLTLKGVADNSDDGGGDDVDHSLTVDDRGQRGPNMVDIVIRSYRAFTMEFMSPSKSGGYKGELYVKVEMLHTFLKSITDKDERLRQMYSLPPSTPTAQLKFQPPVFVSSFSVSATSPPPWVNNKIIPLGSRVDPEEGVDPGVFLTYTDWSAQHYHLYTMIRQINRSGGSFLPMAGFTHVSSMFIDSGLALNCVKSMDFTEAARHGQRIMSDFRAYVCQSGTWALLKDTRMSMVFLQDSFRLSHQVPVFIIARWEMLTNWVLRVSFSLYNGSAAARKIVMDCLLNFSYSFRPEYQDPDRDAVVRAIRPLHLLPLDLEVGPSVKPGMLTTRDIGDMHTYVVEWRWTYLAREGTSGDLYGKGPDSDIVRQALHRLALTLGINRLTQDFTLINAKGESTGLMTGLDASKYDSCLTFYHEREGYEGEELLLACQYQVIVNMAESSVTARTWVEPWSARIIRMLFENDFRMLAPLGTFQQILQPGRCFQLKVPNIAEFHSKRMNMFSIMAVVASSRIALRVLQLPDISPAHAVWDHPGGADSIIIDDPSYQITSGRDGDLDLEIHLLDENGNVTERIPATEYYKTHDRQETIKLAQDRKLSIKHMGTTKGERHAIILERFMLTMFEKDENWKYDPHIDMYRRNEYNPFILKSIHRSHPRMLFFSKLSAQWMTTGEFTIVAYRCFLEYALFTWCSAISVNAELFNKLKFAETIVSELSHHISDVHKAAGVSNALDFHLYMEKWYAKRLPNNSSFLMVLLPNAPLASRNRHFLPTPVSSEQAGSANGHADSRCGSSPPSSSRHRRQGSEPARPPVLTPALERSMNNSAPSAADMASHLATNVYTLLMECSMDNSEMHRHVHALERGPTSVKSKLNLWPLDVPTEGTRVLGESMEGFVGEMGDKKNEPVPFTDYALAEIKVIERMYSVAYLQTIYLALLLKRSVAPADMLTCLQSTLWKKRSIDVDITAFLHSQDVARASRDAKWQEQDRRGLQKKFDELLGESFHPLLFDVNPSQGRRYFCKVKPDECLVLETSLKLAENPLFISLQCSIEVYDSDIGHKRRLNMPIDELPLSLEQLCEQANIPWRPPTDHFVPLTSVRVILHINCQYLPDMSIISQSSASSDATASDSEQATTLLVNPDKHELESLSTRPFQKTMSLASLVTSEFDPVALCAKAAINRTSDSLPSAIIAKKHMDAQLATLKGLPHDQLELVRLTHRMFVRFVAQETLHALRDIKPVTVPLLNQVWHTIATTVDKDAPLDRYAFSQNKIGFAFLVSTTDKAKRQHAIDLAMSELLKLEGHPVDYLPGKLCKLGSFVYMRDLRSRSERSDAQERWRVRAISDAQSKTGDPARSDSSSTVSAKKASLADAVPSWFLIKPTASLDGVRVLTHNYSVVTSEAASNVLSITRQVLTLALKAANTRLLLEEMADTRMFPELLDLPSKPAFDIYNMSGTQRWGPHVDSQAARAGQAAGTNRLSASPSALQLASNPALPGDIRAPAPVDSAASSGLAISGIEANSGTLHSTLDQEKGERELSGGSFNIVPLLEPYIPSNPKFHSCKKQFTHTFPLHPRIPPVKAVLAVLASGMLNNRLTNQRNMFFVRDGESIFYAELLDSRMSYVSPFETSGPSSSRQLASQSSVATPVGGIASPMYSAEATLPGARTVATTSPDPTNYSSLVDASHMSLTSALSLTSRADATSQTAGAQAQGVMPPGVGSRRRSPLIPALSTSALPLMPPSGAGDAHDAAVPESPLASPRMLRSESLFRGSNRYAIAESALQNRLSTTPESPLGRYLPSSLTNLEGQRLSGGTAARTFDGDSRLNASHRQVRASSIFPHMDAPRSPTASRDAFYPEEANAPTRAVTPSANAQHQLHQSRTLHAASTSAVPALGHPSSSNSHPTASSEEKSTPCIALYIYGLVKPSKEMTQGLVQQIGEHIMVHVAMPEMSDMLFRRVALYQHDMDFLFPKCNPEPTIVYLPLPQFVHDLDRLLLHFRQALGDIIVPFPASELLATAMRRSYNHLLVRHDDDDNDESVSIGNRVPSSLREDLVRVLEGWRYDRETPCRVPVERLTFLYNFFTKSGAPPPEMTDIGTGIAIVSALPLSKSRVVSSGIWSPLPSADSSGTTPSHPASSSRRNPSTRTMVEGDILAAELMDDYASVSGPFNDATSRRGHQSGLSFSSGGSSPVTTDSSGDSGASDPQPIPVSELAGLFNEYLRQFKAAREHIKLDAADFDNLPQVMNDQVAEFSGEPVVAITMWSNASVRLDRLAAYVSRVYWNALGDYVSEQVLYPILSAGWGHHPNPVIKLPDPTVSIDSCYGYYGNSSSRIRSAEVAVSLHPDPNGGQAATQSHLALLRAREIHIPKAPSTFTENTKKQVHAMEIARQMAQYWGSQESVKSLRHHRQKLPRVTGISHWFSEELRGVLETMCPSMHPALFRLLENPLVLDGTSQSAGHLPKPLFPAISLRQAVPRDHTSVVYDVSALPKALKGTRQSFCIMCTLPLDEPLGSLPASASASHAQSATFLRGGRNYATQDSNPGSGTMHHKRMESLRRPMGDSGHQRPSARSSIGSNAAQMQGSIHGLGLQGLSQSDQQKSPQKHSRNKFGNNALLGRRPYRLPDITGHPSVSLAPKKMPPPSDYKPIADPETLVLDVDDITYYPSHSKVARVSSSAWLVVWLVGGELEMVGYNVSQRLWDCVCDQIKQRLERESRRKQLLGMFASHMGGIFPGYDRQARHKGITSTWLDRNVTRDLINKFALQQQLTVDDQVHYFNIERMISPDYARLLGLYEGSANLESLIANPPVAGMTLNDMKTEVVLRQLQPEHLRWTRKLTFVDFTQPYVDTSHPDTLFRIGSRFMRAYQGRILQVLRYDELMKIAERWRQLVAVNGLHEAINRPMYMSMYDAHTSDTQTSSLGEHRIVSRNTSTMSASVSAPNAFGSAAANLALAQRNEAHIQAPARGDLSASASGQQAPAVKGKHVAAEAAPKDERSSEISLDDIRMLIDNARLLHFVCAPLPIARGIKPASADLRGFSRLFRVVSAMLQNLADSYIDYLCSTGHIVARRFEKALPWREALAGLGYEPENVAHFTRVMLGLPRRRRSSSQHLPSDAESVLPEIQAPCAYLIANTDRTNLVTQIEVSPQMLSIHMHALSRSTPEWRSAVPGYVKSSVKTQSIKKFAFELSKYKKLLHAKSFVYDFQLRYIVSLLKPVEPAEVSAADQAGEASKHKHQPIAAIYSSDSEVDEVDYASDCSEPSGTDAAENDLFFGMNRRKGPWSTVAQQLHVHIDLMLFFAELSEQRYFSTRFSSRRLVRTRLPMTYREIYEYFLSHSERYHFYTDGCRPTIACSGPSVQSGKLPVSSVCSDIATHSGCYRLYEGTNADGPHSHYAGFFQGSGMVSEPGSLMWPHTESQPGTISRGTKIASSAPEPTSRLAHISSGPTGVQHNSQHGHPLVFNSKGRGAHLYGSDRASPILKPSSEQRAHGGGGKQAAASYAPASQLWSNVMGNSGVPSGSDQRAGTNYMSGALPLQGRHNQAHLYSAPAMSVPSPSQLGAGSIKSRSSLIPHANHGSQAESQTGHGHVLAKSLEFAQDEYSACKIHLSSNDAFVRVSLMALAPDCDSCRADLCLETQRSKERQLSHSQTGGADGRGERRRHRHHHRHRHQSKRDDKEEDATGQTEPRHRRHRRRNGRGNDADAIDDIDGMFGGPGDKSARSTKQPYHHSFQPLAATAKATNIAGSRVDTEAGRQQQRYGESRSGMDRQSPLQRWMSSLASDFITDPQLDGLQASAGKDPNQVALSHDSAAQLSFYLVIDMDPQTTIGLNNLQADDSYSRNGSLVPVRGSVGHVANVDDMLGSRQCQSCRSLSLGVGKPKVCGIHKVLGAVQVDMRDWENKGDVWAAEPTMVMEVSEIDPDEYDREDPDIVAWIKETARRVIRYAMADYHRDFNWYLVYQRLRVADIPRGLVPNDVGDLVAFIERQSWIDVGSTDEAVQQLLGLNISAQHIIEALQLRLRRIYVEPALVMASMLRADAQTAASHPVPPTTDDQQHLRSSYRHKSRTTLAAVAQGGLDTPFALSRTSTMDPLPQGTTHAGAGCLPDDDAANKTCHQCPAAAIDAHGQVIYEHSSSNIDDVLRLLSPLNSSPYHKILLDPSFQRTFSQYVQLSVADCPWLCQKHGQLTAVPAYTWALDSVNTTSNDGALAAAVGGGDYIFSAQFPHIRDGAPTHSASRRAIHQAKDSNATPVASGSISRYQSQRSRVGGASIASLATADSPSSSYKAHHTSVPMGGSESMQLPHSLSAHRMLEPLQHRSGKPIDASAAQMDRFGQPEPPASISPATDLFAHARVESLPGSLLVVDPEDNEFAARLLVLNPFAYHSVLELLFVRSPEDGGEARLDKIRAVARLRQRDGLHEYERKHINLALSTISAVVWDLATSTSD
ncbi:hypothetical protein IW152_004228 [Coemansia sp. BCRC 34962]|nr:hypothetical protein IW152_004228 [Coemansia sp. BCRC 34962]